MLLEAAALLIGLALLVYSSERTVDNSVKLAQAFRVPPFIIGVVLVSLGTDVPEITNSIISSVMGHGDINVGNIFGSPLAQITLILGLAVFFGRKMKVKQAEIARLGIATLAATALALLLANDGDLTRADAAALIVSYITFLLYICRCDSAKLGIRKIREETVKSREHLRIFLLLAVSLVGVVIGSMLVVNSAISLSKGLGISEFLIGFFIIGLGTSLPELAVELTAARKGQFALAIGDAFGSNVTDLTLALGIGPLLSPNILTAGLATATGAYLIAATAVVVGLLGWRLRIGKKEGIVLILLYLGSYLIIPLL